MLCLKEILAYGGLWEFVPVFDSLWEEELDWHHQKGYICDVIKQNESELANIDFKI